MPGKRKPRGSSPALTHLPVCSVANGVQTISGSQLETLLRSKGIELGDRRLRQLAQEGFFPEPERGEYEFLATLLGLVAYFRDLNKKKTDTRRAIDDRTALARCEVAEVEAARVKSEVEEVAEVERSRIALVMVVRQKLLAFPAAASSYLACCQTQQQMETELERQIETILQDLEAPVFIGRGDSPPAGPDPVAQDGGGKQPGA